MELRSWEQLPPEMQNKKVRRYFVSLYSKRVKWTVVRICDICLSSTLIVAILLPGIVISVIIMLDSPGGPFFLQERIKQYGESFKIIKFRTMRKQEAEDRDNMVGETGRTTRIGKILRKYRIDEVPQLINILKGDMAFVGTRPEVKKFVDSYSEEMYATLLLPPGLTSITSIKYKDEEQILAGVEDPDMEYIKSVLPEKMKYNLDEILHIGFFYNIEVLLRTVKEVFL